MDILSGYWLSGTSLIADTSEPALSIIDYVSRGGFVVMLLLILYGGLKKWWVFGWVLTECNKREEDWKAIALENLHVADKSARIGEKLAERKSP